MSFSFGVSDFIAVINLANKVRKRFVDSPAQFKAISDEVKSLSDVLRDVEDVFSERGFTPQQKDKLKDIMSGCHNNLTDLDRILGKYQDLDGSKPASFGKQSKRLWKRMKWEPDDIRDLRSRLSSNVELLSTFIGTVAIGLAYATKTGVDQMKSYQDEQKDREILDWLSSDIPSAQQKDVFSGCQAGTGQWLLDSQDFRSWLSGKEPTLFCPGIPGAGKTMLTSIVIDHLENRFGHDSDVSITYLYCNYKQQADQTIEHLMASLLKQLLLRRSSLPSEVKSLHKLHNEKRTRPNVTELSNTLSAVSHGFSRSFILLDALDECTDLRTRSRLLKEVFNLQTHPGVSLFATSRSIPEIVAEFKGQLSLEIRATNEDVHLYLQDHMDELPRCIQKDISLQETIKTEITLAVNGMFLLARLHLESLADKTTIKAVKLALQALPKGSEALDIAYQGALERIEGQKAGLKQLAKHVLSWLVCANRELTIEELRHALAVEDDTTDLDEDNIAEVDVIISACAGLVTLEMETDIIRLVHYTTQEYFGRTLLRWAPNAEKMITETCLTYLSFQTVVASANDIYNYRYRDHVLLEYAAHSWASHARKCWSVTTECKVLEFLRNEMSAFSCLKAIFDSLEHDDFEAEGATALHISALFGLDSLAAKLLREDHPPDAKDKDGRTPLFYAMYEYLGAALVGQEAVVKLLLESDDVDVNAVDSYGVTPLIRALRNEREDKAILLLKEKCIQVNPNKLHRTSPLIAAIKSGSENTTRLLLERTNIINCEDKGGSTALIAAAGGGHEVICRLLLERPELDINQQNSIGKTALMNAACWNHEAVVRLLLERSELDVNNRDCWGETAFMDAASRGYKTVVRLLLERSELDINCRNNEGSTALIRAATGGFEAIVKLLRKAETDVNQQNDDGETALMLASRWGDHSTVVLLLERHDIQMELRDKHNNTALMLAYGGKQAEIVGLLERAGAPGEIPEVGERRYVQKRARVPELKRRPISVHRIIY